MSKKGKISPAIIFCWAAVMVMLAALITTSMMVSSVEPVGKSIDEIRRVVDQLDSVSSIKTIFYNYSHQYSSTEANLNKALSFALGFLTLGSLLVVALVIALMQQLSKVRKLREHLERVQSKSSR